MALNDSGQVVGYSNPAGSNLVHAFVYDGSMHDLGTLGGSNSYAQGINNHGIVVGFSDTSTGADHAFIYDAMHGMIDLNSLISPASGWVLSHANGINDAGQIVGDGIVDGQQHAFVLTVVPEPSGFALAGICFGALRRIISPQRQVEAVR